MKNPAYEQIQARKVKGQAAHAAARAAHQWQRQPDLPIF
jgi:hypothetical protein